MKKIFTLVVILLSVFPLFAQANYSRLTIQSLSNEAVTIMVDNRTYQISSSDRSIQLSVSAGNHIVKIYRQQNRTHWRKPAQVLYQGTLYLKRGYETDVILNRFGRVFIDEQVLNTFNDNNDNWHGQYEPVMNAYDFEQLKQTLSRQSYDNTRLVIGKQAVTANKFTAQQAKELIMLYTYESSKLEMAKHLYTFTVDKSNYVIVYDVLAYSSSREELARYIQQTR